MAPPYDLDMKPTAQTIWDGLEFRRPMMVRNIEPLSEEQMHWLPGAGRNSIAWQLWHNAEVEDNWIRDRVMGEPLRFPFGVRLADASKDEYPPKHELLAYFTSVRDESRRRLTSATEADFEAKVTDADFGTCTVREIWMGVVTGFAWHAGQIALTAKIMPNSPVTTQSFKYLNTRNWEKHVD